MKSQRAGVQCKMVGAKRGILSLFSSDGYIFLIVAIPRQNIVHDIFSFVACGVTTPRLIEECPDLLSLRPATQEIQVASIKAIPMYRYDKLFYFNS